MFFVPCAFEVEGFVIVRIFQIYLWLGTGKACFMLRKLFTFLYETKNNVIRFFLLTNSVFPK